MAAQRLLVPVMFVIPRISTEERTVAVIQAHVPSALTKEQAFFAALTGAITDWIIATPDGVQAWNRSSHDYNIGDLSTDLDNPTLKARLWTAQIYKLTIDCFVDLSASGNWTYDTVLVKDRVGE